MQPHRSVKTTWTQLSKCSTLHYSTAEEEEEEGCQLVMRSPQGSPPLAPYPSLTRQRGPNIVSKQCTFSGSGSYTVYMYRYMRGHCSLIQYLEVEIFIPGGGGGGASKLMHESLCEGVSGEPG